MSYTAIRRTSHRGGGSLQWDVAIGPDWSVTGSAGMLQELNYIASRYRNISQGNWS